VAEVPTQTDSLASAEYRRELIPILVARALMQAVGSQGEVIR
jgi:CO/xanthine dehydrogenase FAD-binding subunit